MLVVNSVTFKDSETGKVIEVHLPDGHVTSNEKMNADEQTTCSFYAGLLLAGGISKLKEFLNKSK